MFFSRTQTQRRKLRLLLPSLALSLSLVFGACASPKASGGDGAKKRITVTTSFLYDMSRQLLGDQAQLELIIPAGDDPHLYNAKPQDLQKLQQADLVLYHGLHFEGKMAEALEKSGAKAVTADFSPEDSLRMEEDGQEVVDPHFWFSIPLYKKATETAGRYLDELYKGQGEVQEQIRKRLADYLQKLDALDQENKQKFQALPKERRILVTPHDAFNYFAKAYDFEVKAPQGVSTDSEVANRDLADTATFIVQHQVPAIFAETSTDPARMDKLQELVQQMKGSVKVVSGEKEQLFSDSLAPEGQPGDSYIDMYRHNVDTIVGNLRG